MSASETILVTGATGNTGSALLYALAARGATVRAMVRPGEQRALATPSATPVEADFDDAASLAAALRGVTRAYLVTPSSPTTEEQQVRFADVAKGAGVQHLVLLSQFASEEQSPVRFLRYHAAVERHIREIGLGYTFLRPNLFMQTLLTFGYSIATTNAYYAPLGDARVSLIDVRDIAAVAAVVLTEDGHLGQTYTLTGPAALSQYDVAAAMSRVLGRQITFGDAPPEAARAGMIQYGVPEWQADGMLEDFAHYRRGEAEVVTSTVQDITGQAPRDIETFLRDYAAAFTQAS
jgi:uncharacterized protein YbjT (DUF2867 family)